MLRTVFERLFAERAGREEGMHYDLLGHDSDDETPTSPEIIEPINYAPALRHLRCRDNAKAIAQQLLGPQATGTFEYAILKPAKVGGATPWHQDEAYCVDSKFVCQQVSFWIPLSDVTSENSCMMFVPGSHKLGVLPHGSHGNDPRIHAIECIGGFNHEEAVACPLSAGGATVHHGRTLHFATPNRSSMPRIAYILGFNIPPVRLPERRDFYWNRQKQAAHLARKRRWRLRGGIFVEVLRKLRSGTLHRPGRLLFELRGTIRAAWNLIRSR
jgi:hypothetical protein